MWTFKKSLKFGGDYGYIRRLQSELWHNQKGQTASLVIIH